MVVRSSRHCAQPTWRSIKGSPGKESLRVGDPGEHPGVLVAGFARLNARLFGVNLNLGNKPGVPGPLPSRGLSSVSRVTRKRSARKGVSRLEEFLICKNRECRFLVSLRDGSKLLRPGDIIFSACPECGHEWSGRCPFCLQSLKITWERKIPCCAHCQKPLKPEVRAD